MFEFLRKALPFGRGSAPDSTPEKGERGGPPQAPSEAESLAPTLAIGEAGSAENGETPLAAAASDAEIEAPKNDENGAASEADQVSDDGLQQDAVLLGRRSTRCRQLVREDALNGPTRFTPEQRLGVVQAWEKSGLPGTEFANLVRIPATTLYTWRRNYREQGPEGLQDKPRTGRGTQLTEAVRGLIVATKEANSEWGCYRIRDELKRVKGISVSSTSVVKVLKQAGYVLREVPSRPHGAVPHRFERARPNQLLQTDLFTFLLKRENRRLHLVVFMDDHSRFIVSYGIGPSPTKELVCDALLAAITNYGPPERC